MISLYPTTDLFRPNITLVLFPVPKGLFLPRGYQPEGGRLVNPSRGIYEFLRLVTVINEDTGERTKFARCWNHTDNCAVLFFLPREIEDEIDIPERLQRKNDVIQERMKPRPFTDR